ncbi:hypothetical protein FEM48_Zijuj10G0153500 [Ziziphus jujuba var. spinosa]|uniref:RNA polymerase Rpb4/RPC9 core domain-containing protein n=1 Tax=Ziziphus jujuba var. spinosa TaxID=714518 RepID=A0A978UP60_ZIZJJ|nr:hypothetical protein FEM48_Zijuj10G0153500 [Ziziphus jujuba var. spinosa]
MSGEEEENAAELKIGDEFLKAKCLMNCEVSLILEHKYEQLRQTSEDPMNQVSQVFEKSLQYVKRFSRYKNPDAVRQVREILSRYQLAEFELCVLGNLCPETVEEAIAMVPSIKVFYTTPCNSLSSALTQLYFSEYKQLRHVLHESFGICCVPKSLSVISIKWSLFFIQTKGRAHDDEAIEKMLTDLSLIKRFE